LPGLPRRGQPLLLKETLQKIRQKKMVAFTYCREDMSPADGEYPFNPTVRLRISPASPPQTAGCLA